MAELELTDDRERDVARQRGGLTVRGAGIELDDELAVMDRYSRTATLVHGVGFPLPVLLELPAVEDHSAPTGARDGAACSANAGIVMPAAMSPWQRRSATSGSATDEA